MEIYTNILKIFILRLTDQHKEGNVLHAHCIPAESPNLGSFWLKKFWTQLLKHEKLFCITLALAIIKFIWFNDILIVLILFSWEISPGFSSGTTFIRFTGNLSTQTLSLTDRELVPEKETARKRISIVKKYTIIYIIQNWESFKTEVKQWKHSTLKSTGKNNWIWSQKFMFTPGPIIWGVLWHIKNDTPLVIYDIMLIFYQLDTV